MLGRPLFLGQPNIYDINKMYIKAFIKNLFKPNVFQVPYFWLPLETYFQEDAVDPRLSRLYCLKVHERKKQFLSKLGQIPHKLLAAERVNSLKRNKVAYHRFELLSYNPD